MQTFGIGAWRRHVAAVALWSIAAMAQAVTITVNTLADDAFPDAGGVLVDLAGNPYPNPIIAHCTLRMAISAANLNLLVGGANGCNGAGGGADTINFTVTGTIALADRGMSEAPALYSPPQIIQSALIVSQQLTITGPGSALLTIDGGLPGNSGRRLLNVSDGDPNIDSPFQLTGVRFLRGRAVEQSSGCMFASDSVTIADVIFESCESVGGPTQGAFGGALGVGNVIAGTYAPTAVLTNTQFIGNRATRGNTTTALPQVGAAFFGSATRKVGQITISNSRFLGNSAESVGALFVRGAAVGVGNAVSISNTQFISNTATGTAASLNGGRYGGFQITGTTGDINIADVGVIGNTANQERAGFSIITVSGTTTIANVTALGNVAILGRIGGFEVLTDSFDVSGNCQNLSKHTVNISGVNVESNRAATNTAGFRVLCSGDVSITGSDIRNNEVFGSPVVGSGGNSAGQVNTNTSVTMADVRVIRNRTYAGAVDGGFGVFLVFDNGSFNGTRLLFRDNYAQKDQAAMTLRANASGSVRNYGLSDSVFYDNFAEQSFSALFLDRAGNYTVRNTTLSGNRSASSGAFFVNMNAPADPVSVSIENVTSARNLGGNLALEIGSFAAPANGTVTIKNSILGSGTSGIGAASANLQTPAGVSYVVSNSLIENSSFGVPAGICGVNGTLCNVNARLENLNANGGPTPTHALRPGSPALDSGSNVGVVAPFDQRGTPFSRIVNSTVDMGAFESPTLPALCTLDIDGNGTLDALTDGLIVIRAMFGLTGTAVTNGMNIAGAPRSTWALLQPYLNGSCGANFAP